MNRIQIWILNVLLLASLNQIAQAGVPASDERRVHAVLRADLGAELDVRHIAVSRTQGNRYRIDLQADVTGYPDASRREIRSIVRQIAVESLMSLGYDLDPDSRFRFTAGSAEVSEVRGQQPITLVLFMPHSRVPRTIRISPSATYSLARNKLDPAKREMADALGVEADSSEIAVNARQVYLKYRNQLKEPGRDKTSAGPIVLYSRWWGAPPPPPAPPGTRVEKVSLLKPWRAGVQFWHAEMAANVSTGGVTSASSRAVTNSRLVPELQLGAGRFWLSYQKMSHKGTVPEPFSFASAVPFLAGTTLDFQLERLQIAGRHTIAEHNENQLQAVLGLDLFIPNGKLLEPTGRRGSLEGMATGPLIGLLGQTKLSKHMYFGAGFEIPIAVLGKSQVTGFDFEAGLGYRFPKGLTGRETQLGLGYRITDLEIRRGDGASSPTAGAIDPEYKGFFLDLRTSW